MAGLLDEIASSETISGDSPVSCSKCGCPIQWKPFLVESVPWRCVDCFPPQPGLSVPHQRWLESLPGQPTRWRASNEATGADTPIHPIDPWITNWLSLVEKRRERDGLCRCGILRERKIASNLGWRVECECGRVIRFEE